MLLKRECDITRWTITDELQSRSDWGIGTSRLFSQRRHGRCQTEHLTDRNWINRLDEVVVHAGLSRQLDIAVRSPTGDGDDPERSTF